MNSCDNVIRYSSAVGREDLRVLAGKDVLADQLVSAETVTVLP